MTRIRVIPRPKAAKAIAIVVAVLILLVRVSRWSWRPLLVMVVLPWLDPPAQRVGVRIGDAVQHVLGPGELSV